MANVTFKTGHMTNSIKPTDIKPPFDEEKSQLKVKAAENAWNTCNPELVAQAYTPDSKWRNRTEFFTGRKAIIDFLRRKWAKELDYHLMNEHWEFDDSGLMRIRDMSANDYPIKESERRYR